MASQTLTQVSPDRLPSRNIPQPASHSRDVSTARGRPVDSVGLSVPSLQTQSQTRSQSTSKSPEPGSSRSGSAADGDITEKRPPNSYGHHRQASIVHGNIQHTRSPSLAPLASANPLSPEAMPSVSYGIATGGDSRPNGKRENSPLSAIQDAKIDLGSDQTHHRKGTQSGRSRREHISHSKSGTHEARTVGEYALHHLFNSVRDHDNLREAGFSDFACSL
ncbi:hypothetical protein PRK78_002821 [Emydomyces testavorans]|uniref:Uncharacterized protein n=1 Tax=Emydomyces testavorans TaxID=2070801 RepID=A0AAF0IGW1_9EURO|nr:hypothetical protein PRK78_002821 [Emydomyces testavorans]